MINKICADIIEEKNIRENLIQLNQMIRSEDNMDRFLDIYYENEDAFMGLLEHEDAKVRKNIIKLLGRVADPVLLEPLFSHYMEDETLFLKGDYLAALAAFDYKEYLPELKKRKEELEQQERTKHSLEELKQLQKLIWKAEPPKKHLFQTTGEEDLLLIVPRGHEEKVLEDISKIPDTKGRAIGGGCVVHTKNLADVADIRTYQALLFDFYPSLIQTSNGGEIAQCLLSAGLPDYLRKHHKEDHPFLFRTDVKGVTSVAEKNQIARDFSVYLEENSGGTLINEPSFYEIEFRLIGGKKGFRVFLKLTALKDERFSYRKYAMATSMQPSKAALMMKYVQPYFKEDANVLDPFCGTGTLLIERVLAGKCKSMYGLDISGQAIQAAWENSRRADKMINLIQRNFNDFKHEYKFDEILTDMPRQSSSVKSKQLEYLYELLFLKSRELMADRAVLAVYCENKELMDRQVSRNRWLKCLKRIPMSKDQTTWLFILQNS